MVVVQNGNGITAIISNRVLIKTKHQYFVLQNQVGQIHRYKTVSKYLERGKVANMATLVSLCGGKIKIVPVRRSYYADVFNKVLV